jgi:hypothetical protein
LDAGITVGYGGHSTINYAKLLSAIKEIAELSFVAGYEKGDGDNLSHATTPPTKEQFINQLFNDTP